MRRARRVLKLAAGARGCGNLFQRRRSHRCEIFSRIYEAVVLDSVLLVVQLPISSIERDQLSMRAALDDLPTLDDENLVGAFDSGKPVSDHERGSAASK